jgi:quinol monooxygenase YgiN
MKPGCTLIAYLHAKPEKREELLKVLHSFIKPSRAEPACVDYHLYVSNDDPNLFIFYENWRTRGGTRRTPAHTDSCQLLVAAP